MSDKLDILKAIRSEIGLYHLKCNLKLDLSLLCSLKSLSEFLIKNIPLLLSFILALVNPHLNYEILRNLLHPLIHLLTNSHLYLLMIH